MFNSCSKKIAIPFTLAFACLTGVFPAAGQDKVGTTSASFLGIAVGARSVAMGSAYTAIAGDATSLYWNPGAVAKTGKSSATFVHNNWFLDTNFNWAGAVLSFGPNAVGISLTSLDFGDEPVTTVFEPDGTGEIFSAQDVAIGVSYSRNLTDRFTIGGTVKFISQEIFNETATGVAADVGLLFTTQFRDFQLGVSFSNLGSDLQLDGKDLLQRVDLDPNAGGNNETIVALLKTDDFQLPVIFRVGISGDLLRFGEHSRLLLSAEATQPNDNSGIVNVGGELAVHKMFFLRAGYQSLFRDNTQEGLTFGGGLVLNVQESTALVLDYAYADFGLLENVQLFSVGVSF